MPARTRSGARSIWATHSAALVASLALVIAGALSCAVAAVPAGAQGSEPANQSVPETTATTTPFDASSEMPRAPTILPRPNSGEEPKSATARGGWAQYAVLGGILVGLAGVGLLIRRDSQRKRSNRTVIPTATTPDESVVESVSADPAEDSERTGR